MNILENLLPTIHEGNWLVLQGDWERWLGCCYFVDFRFILLMFPEKMKEGHKSS